MSVFHYCTPESKIAIIIITKINYCTGLKWWETSVFLSFIWRTFHSETLLWNSVCFLCIYRKVIIYFFISRIFTLNLVLWETEKEPDETLK